MPEKGGSLTSPDPGIKRKRTRLGVMDFVPLYRIVFEQCQHVTSSDAVDMVLVYDAS